VSLLILQYFDLVNNHIMLPFPEYPVSGARRSRPGCNPTRATRSRTRSTGASVVWSMLIGDRSKTKLVRYPLQSIGYRPEDLTPLAHRKRTKTGPLAGGEDPAFDDDGYANEHAHGQWNGDCADAACQRGCETKVRGFKSVTFIKF